jgi:hypothetical protein
MLVPAAIWPCALYRTRGGRGSKMQDLPECRVQALSTKCAPLEPVGAGIVYACKRSAKRRDRSKAPWATPLEPGYSTMLGGTGRCPIVESCACGPVIGGGRYRA